MEQVERPTEQIPESGRKTVKHYLLSDLKSLPGENKKRQFHRVLSFNAHLAKEAV
jgi:hypothetical protein